MASESDEGITFITLFVLMYNIILSISVTKICHLCFRSNKEMPDFRGYEKSYPEKPHWGVVN